MRTRVLCIGEQWNSSSAACVRPDVLARWQRKWDGRLALWLGGMGGGQSAYRLAKLGFRWDKGCNVLPPALAWDAALASTVADQIIAARPAEVLLLCGQRVWRAFGCTKMLTFYGQDGMLLLTLPHPSPRCPTWRQAGVTETARQAAIAIKGHLSC
jgi:hypothetical protein